MAPVRQRLLITALAVTIACAGVATPVAAAVDGLVLHYANGVDDVSGHRAHGTLAGDATRAGIDGVKLGGVDGHVQLPANLLTGKTAVSVSLQVRIAPDQRTPYFIWGIGSSVNGAGNGYLFTTGNGYRTSIATGNWSTEQTVSAGHDLPRDRWTMLTYTLGGGTAVLYEDGVEVGRRTGVTIAPADFTSATGYLGRSLYSTDHHLKGYLRDFRVYDRVVTPAEAQELARIPDSVRVARDANALDIGDTSLVTENLTLPTAGPHDTKITWRSSNPAVVSPTGVVTRPAAGRTPAFAIVTATVSRGSSVRYRMFALTVRPLPTDREKADEAAAALKVWDADDLRGNITLPSTGLHGTTITWKSTKPKTITPTGEVTRPAPGERPAKVTLTAIVQSGQRRVTRRFDVTVRPLPQQQAYEGYLFGYFTGEGTANGEQVYFAASRGNDPLHWDELNGGNPVLTSSLGDKGVRDPFIIRSPEGDKFYLIATDLKIYGNGNWDAVQRHGSKSIEVWESTDLVHWSGQRHVQVSPDTAGNTWAPEAYYDESIGAYVVFWASKIYAANDPNHTGSTYNKMLYATTRDFRTFSEPKVWVDPGYSVIDSTVIEDGNTYYRFTKDERNNTSTTPCSKFILAEKSTELRDTTYDFVADCIGKGVVAQGEGPTVFKSNTENKWYLLIDEFGGRGYIPLETTDLASGRWTATTGYELPRRPRHGTVLPITKAELDRVRAAYK